MTEMRRKPKRTSLKRGTGEYRKLPDEIFEQPTYPDETESDSRWSGDDASAQQRRTTQSRVIVVQQNSGNNFLNTVTWPFRKTAQAIAWLTGVIIATVLRSVITIIISIIISTLMLIFISVYMVALLDTNMDFIQAFYLSFERISLYIQNFSGFQNTVDSIKNTIPTPRP